MAVAAYLDIPSIKQDPDRWRRDFFWPVSDREWFALSEAAFDLYEEAFAGLDVESRDALLMDFTFYYLLLFHLHARKAVEEFTRQGAEVRGENQYLAPDWDASARAYDLLPRAGWKLGLRSLAKNLQFNHRLGAGAVLSWLGGRSQVLGLGTVTQVKDDYLRRQGIVADHRYLEQILVPDCKPVKVAATEAAWGLLRNLAALVREQWGLDLPIEGPGRAWENRLQRLAGHARGLAEGRRFPRELHVTEVGQPLVKLACLAARRQGSRLVGYCHGNDIGMLHYRVFSYVEPPHFHRFLLPTPAAARSVEEKYALSGMGRYYPVEFGSLDSSCYGKMLEAGRAHALPDQIRTVMVMGYPLNDYRYLDDAGNYFPIQLELQLRVLDVLRAHGFKVLYKGHPDRKDEARGLFEAHADEVVFTRFEECWTRADALLFTYPGTTTFGFALCTNRPMVLLDNQSQQWGPAVRRDLGKRCAMVPVGFDERNRIVFSEDELLEVLARPVAAPDHSVVTSFMTTQGGGACAN